MDVLGIDEEKFFDCNILKIYNGMGGTAKSTICTNAFNSRNKDFLRCTSTQKLLREALARFGGKCSTIASALCKNKDGNFYDEIKEPEDDTLLIDEVLQSSPIVFDFCRKYVGKKNIVLLTDSKQMLPPMGDILLKHFEELKNEKYVAYASPRYSYRPKTEETRKLYNLCYDADSDGFELWQIIKKLVDASDKIPDYIQDAAFICHTNAHENFLYDIYDLYNRYDLSLIPKGSIASKNILSNKYPILPQAKIKNVASYYQIENIGSVTRYQGSEVEQGTPLYYVIGRGQMPTNREIYTMVTRAKDMRDIHIIYKDIEEAEELKTFYSLPVYHKATVNMMSSQIPEKVLKSIKEKGYITDEQEYDILWNYNNSRKDKESFATRILIDGESVKKEPYKSSKVTMSSLIKKEPLLRVNFMPKFLMELEKVGSSLNQKLDEIQTPSNVDIKGSNTDTAYCLDLHSAYPHIFKNSPMIDGRFFFTNEEVPEEEAKNRGYIRLYVNLTKFGCQGMIMTGELADYIDKYAGEDYMTVEFNIDGKPTKIHMNRFKYLGSCKAMVTHKTGDYLYKQAYKSAESKARLKNIHYGWLQKPFIEGVDIENGKPTGYIINENNVAQLQMVCIQSSLSLQILKIKRRVYGDIYHGTQLIDALYFNTNEDLYTLGEDIKDILCGFDFRIVDNSFEGKTSDKPVLYKTYEDLKKRSHHKKKES